MKGEGAATRCGVCRKPGAVGFSLTREPTSRGCGRIELCEACWRDLRRLAGAKINRRDRILATLPPLSIVAKGPYVRRIG